MVKFKDINNLSSAELQRLKYQSERFRIAYAASQIQAICDKSESSQFFPFGGEGYKTSVRHYLESSSEISYAAVQPGSVEDLSKIIKVLGATKAPFGIKGGGHATNPKFSSTRGVQLSMARFNKIQYHKDTQTLDVGAGCLFDEVYRALNGTGRNIVGGSAIGGVGIAGWLLGGGYSLKTNQYGLGIDNVVGVKMVLPSGVVTHATKKHNSLLLNAVRGGGNNFGIVTEFTLKTHAQPPIVYGGLLEYEADDADDVKDAVVDFVNECTDPKAAIVAAFRYYNRPGGQQFKLTVQYFYDGPKPRVDPFRKFLDVPHNLVLADGAGAGQEHPGASSNLTYFEFDHAFSEMNDDTMTDVIDMRSLVEPEVQDDDFESSIAPYISELEGLDYKDFTVECQHKNCGIHYDDSGGDDDSEYTQTTLFTSSRASGVDEEEAVPRMYKKKPDTIGTNGTSEWKNNNSSTGEWGNGSLFSNGGCVHEQEKPTQDEKKKAISFPLRAMVGIGENARGRWGNVMVSKYTREIVDEVEAQAKRAAQHLTKHSGKVVVVDIWPFVPDVFRKSDHETAWPHRETNGPLLAYFQWEGQENDEFWINQMKRALKALGNKVYGPGMKPTRPVYSNTTLAEYTTVEDVYGQNLPYLSAFRRKVDPEDVMGQTGGFKIPI